MEVRAAMRSEQAEVLALSVRAHEEVRYSRYAPNMAKIEVLFNRAMDDYDFTCIVAKKGGKLIGFLYGFVAEHFFADMRYASNIALYVVPEERGSWAVVKMVRLFELVARARGAHEILIGATSNVDAARVLKLYARLGYEPVGANAVKYLGDHHAG